MAYEKNVLLYDLDLYDFSLNAITEYLAFSLYSLCDMLCNLLYFYLV